MKIGSSISVSRKLAATLSIFYKKLLSEITQFKVQKAGVAAVEFALILPVMLVAYVGVVETTQYYAADRKTLILARTLSDLATQASDSGSGYPSIDKAQLELIFSLSGAVLYPVDPTGAAMRITMFGFDSTVPAIGGSNSASTDTKAFVDWSDTCTIKADGTCTMGASSKFAISNNRCDTEQVPLGIAAKNSYVLRAEVTIQYKPIIGGLFTFMPIEGLPLYNSLYMTPRNTQSGASKYIVRAYPDGITTAAPNDVATKCAPAFKV